MAVSAGLLPGFKYEIKDGDLAGEIVTVKDNKAVPDGLPNQRKILVINPLTGKDFYILPRQLIPIPIGVGFQEAPAPLPPQAPQLAPMVEVAVKDLPESVQAQVPAGTTTVMQFAPITDPMDPRLNHWRPSKAQSRTRDKGGPYVPRIMDNGMTDIEFFLTFTNEDYRAENQGRPASISLNGHTQSGKTILVNALAVAWSERMADEQRAAGIPVTYDKPMPVFTLSGSAGVTDFDLFGQVTSYTDPNTGEERLVYLPGVAMLAAQCGGIFYLDEYQALQGRVTSSLHSFLDSRHMFVNRNSAVWAEGQFMAQVVKVHLDCWVVGTRNDGYRDMGKPNQAFQNRFRHFPWDYDNAVEEKLISSKAIRILAGRLRTAYERKAIKTPVGTKALQQLERDVHTFGPVMGCKIFTGMFEAGQEQADVDAIINDSASTIVALNEELRQEALNKAANAATANPLDDPSI